MSSRRKREEGQELVEYAIVFILLFTVILGIIEFAIVIFTQSSLSNAVREGARFAVVRPNQQYIPANEITESCPGANQIVVRLCDRLPGVARPGDVDVTVVKTAGPAVTVTASYSYAPFFGLIDPFLPDGLTLGSQATMRLE